MAVGDAYVFPGFLTPVLTQLFFPKPQTTISTFYLTIPTFYDLKKKPFETIEEKEGNAGDHVGMLTLSQTTNFGLFQTKRICRRQF